MSQSSSSQTDPIRSPGARRSGEMLLGSSVASSVNSLASQHSMASMQGYATPQHHQGEGPPQMVRKCCFYHVNNHGHISVSTFIQKPAPFLWQLYAVPRSSSQSSNTESTKSQPSSAFTATASRSREDTTSNANSGNAWPPASTSWLNLQPPQLPERYADASIHVTSSLQQWLWVPPLPHHHDG